MAPEQQPEGAGTRCLGDLIDLNQLHRLMELFYQTTGCGHAVLDLDGTVLTSCGWQDICARFHRVHPESARACLESDTYINRHLRPGEFIAYQCKNGMWDIATPIVVAGEHLATIYFGQFFYDDEPVDAAYFAGQAERYGFDRSAYLEALGRVPVLARDHVEGVMRFHVQLVEMLAAMGHERLVRLRAEEALARSEEQYRFLVQNQNDLVVKIDADGRLLFVSPSCCRTFGKPERELVGRPFTLLVHEEDREAVLRSLRSLDQPPHTTYHEERALTVDGWRWFGWSARGVPGSGAQKIREIVSVGRDITETRRAAEALREREEVYRLVTENMTDLVALCDEAGRFAYVSPSYERELGYQPQELLGKPIHELVCEEDLPGILSLIEERSADLAPASAVYRMRHRDGRLLWFETQGRVVFDGQGRNRGAVFDTREVTEKRRLEAELRQAQKMEAVGTLAGGIAHDFNNILAIILGNTDMALESMPTPGPAAGCLREIRKASVRARDMVRRILAFSRQEEPARRSLHLAALVDEALPLLRSLIPSTIEIRKTFSCRDDRVFADATLLERVLMNLFANAAHAMGENGGLLEVRVTDQAPGPDASGRLPASGSEGTVTLSVHDSGRGIPPEDLDRIFDPYFTTKEAHEGSGMGLSVVHGIVAGLGGVIRAESVPGRGTSFFVHLPLAESDPAPERRDRDALPRGTEHLLVVDDEAGLVDMQKQVLEALGYRVTACSNGEQALAAFREHPGRFQLLLTDMTMPGMTGKALAQEVLRQCPGFPVLLCTGYSEAITEEQVRELGIRALVAKPQTLTGLARAVRRALDTPGDG